ncbi:MAG: glycosyltransferase family 4 protein [Bryobacteraceae bacterium]|nr:glycosyltransferase family 4 protein [Bryobacteraceae bacterium]
MSEAPLRIAVITTVAETLAAFFPGQLRALAQQGFEVHAISSPGMGEIPEVQIHGISMERQPSPRRDMVSLLALTRLLRRIRPHIVHAHTPKAGLLGMAAAKLAGVPLRLYTIHGLPLETRTGLWRKVLRSAEQLSCALSTRTYTISPSLRKLALNLRLCAAEKLFTLGDGSCAGIEVDRFDGDADWRATRAEVRASLGVGENELLISFVGRLARDKGIGVLAEAWPAMARELPEAHLLLAGEFDATDQFAPDILHRLRHDARIHLPGSVGNERVPSILAATDVFVLPTFREGLSQVALEAGAMGVPVVSTRVTGVVDAVRDGVTGILVPPHDAGALAQAVIDLAGQPALRKALGRAAISHVRTKFTDRRVNELWMNEYRELAAVVHPAGLPKAMAARSGV